MVDAMTLCFNANVLPEIGWISLVEISTPQLRAKTTSVAVTIQYLTGILFVSDLQFSHQVF
jgi:hypothetical protein